MLTGYQACAVGMPALSRATAAPATSTQLRTVAFRVVNHRCEGRSLYIDIRYSRYEQRESSISYVKGGGSKRPLPGQPIVSDWRPV